MWGNDAGISCWHNITWLKLGWQARLFFKLMCFALKCKGYDGEIRLWHLLRR